MKRILILVFSLPLFSFGQIHLDNNKLIISDSGRIASDKSYEQEPQMNRYYLQQ